MEVVFDVGWDARSLVRASYANEVHTKRIWFSDPMKHNHKTCSEKTLFRFRWDIRATFNNAEWHCYENGLRMGISCNQSVDQSIELRCADGFETGFLFVPEREV
jgi:hypothetical protein